MDPGALPADFRDLLAALCDENAKFVVVGGYALAAHGHARSTDDLDIFGNPTPKVPSGSSGHSPRSVHPSRLMA